MTDPKIIEQTLSDKKAENKFEPNELCEICGAELVLKEVTYCKVCENEYIKKGR